MIQRLSTAGLLVLAILAPVSAGLTLREPPGQEARSGSSVGAAPAATTDRSAELMRLAGDRTPFRLWHRAPSVRFGVAQIAPVAAVPRPHPVLTGLLWGERPSALMEGIPGHEGAVVMSAGDTAGGLRVVQVLRDRVTLTGMDTSWTLTMRQPWP